MATTLHSGLRRPLGIAVDDVAIYYSTNPEDGDGEIWKLAK